MSLVYFKFLFVNTIKRKPIWITWLLFLFTCTCFIIILPAVVKMNTLQVWANTTMAISQTFMGMVAALFTSVLAINIFKDTNEEGTELIVISKPISRFKIVLTKFILFGAFCLAINLSTVLLTVFTIFLPRTEIKYYGGLLISMFIGNAITFGIFGSISILLTVNFAKVGVIITNIIISLVFLVYQTLTLFVFSTPAKALDDQKMSASSYIYHDRNTETGEYKENEVVKFEPASASTDIEHPCKATNWREMKEFWEQDILSKDPTPILNATDLAGQIALTYLSYNTDKYAERQAKRMFALSRFYNYQLTSPASPEIVDDTIEDKQTIQWLYTGANEISLPIADDYQIYFPQSIAFAGIQPLTSTRLRGYTDKIPVGTVKSKEFLSSRDVYFEQEDWKKFSHLFDLMYQDVFDYRNYEAYEDTDEVDLPIFFSRDTNTIKRYYNLVWAALMGKADEFFTIETELSNYDNTSFEIKDVDDLNNRFIQFKNYCYIKSLEEQQSTLYDLSKLSDEEFATREIVISMLGLLYSYLKVTPLANSWMIGCPENVIDGFLEPKTVAPDLTLMNTTWKVIKENLGIHSKRYKEIAPTLSIAKLQKTAKICEVVCNTSETYLYTSLTDPNRTSKYSGRAYMVEDTWYPYLNGLIKEYAKDLGLNINLPLGQNMQYFFYKSTPTLNYWIFSIIWGSISIGLFSAGIVVYNKYDVK